MDFLTIGGLAVAGISIIQLTSRARRRDSHVSEANFCPITTTEELDNVFTTTDGRPQVVFLDDPWCPISAAARRQMKRLDGVVRTIDVSQRSDLTRQLAARTGIRHESPQAIVVNGGVAVWNASHSRISSQAIAQAIARVCHDAKTDLGPPPGTTLDV